MITDIFLERYRDNESVVDLRWDQLQRPLHQASQIVFSDAFPALARLGMAGLVLVETPEEIAKDTHDRICREVATEKMGVGDNYLDRCASAITGKGWDTFSHIRRPHMLSLTVLELLFSGFERAVDSALASLGQKREELMQRIGKGTQMRDIGGNILHSANEMLLQNVDRQIQGLMPIRTNALNEINYRFSKSNVNLRYHAAKIQATEGDVIEKEIEQPFWRLFADPKWKAVVKDFQEAIDRRDNNGRDPTAIAMQGLESVVKIVCQHKGRATGNERGFAHWVDSLVRDVNGTRFIEVWEKDLLITLNREARNPHSHGPGVGPHPVKSPQQIAFCIHCAMAWAQSIATRP